MVGNFTIEKIKRPSRRSRACHEFRSKDIEGTFTDKNSDGVDPLALLSVHKCIRT